jgi:hypothetical protein
MRTQSGDITPNSVQECISCDQLFALLDAYDICGFIENVMLKQLKSVSQLQTVNSSLEARVQYNIIVPLAWPAIYEALSGVRPLHMREWSYFFCA